METKLRKCLFSFQILCAGLILGVTGNFDALGSVRTDFRGHSFSLKVPISHVLSQKFLLLQTDQKCILIAKGPVKEKYHPQAGESQESIKRKSRDLKTKRQQGDLKAGTEGLDDKSSSNEIAEEPSQDPEDIPGIEFDNDGLPKNQNFKGRIPQIGISPPPPLSDNSGNQVNVPMPDEPLPPMN
ncbi:MAG: hypothetical protein L0Y56_00800 [Nitrospira sp.]|nr:hypothetical protein [Nitrospira sp.]